MGITYEGLQTSLEGVPPTTVLLTARSDCQLLLNG